MKPYQSKAGGGGVMISAKELKKLVKAKLGNLVDSELLRTADIHYCLPTYAKAKAIIEKSKMKQLAAKGGAEPRAESFDCDDFALLLKARFAYAAYREANTGNCPYCFGIVWGLLPFPFPHSMNWMITDDREFYFVEPQREQILPLDQCGNFRYLNFMMV